MKKFAVIFFIAVFMSLFSSCAWAKLFDCPIEEVPAKISSAYGQRGNSFHTGYDLGTNGREGLEIYALFDGTVTYRVI